MTSYVTPKKGFPFICYVGLVSQSTGQFQSNPTLAAGDFKLSKDGAALNNLATLPTVTPASSKSVKIALDSDETNADNIVIIGSDAAGAEWDDVFLNIQTTANQIDDLATATALAGVQSDTNDIQVRLPAVLSGDGYIMADMKSIDDELTSGNNATLNLKTLIINNPVGDALFLQSNGGNAIYAASDGVVAYVTGTVGAYIESVSGNNAAVELFSNAGNGLLINGVNGVTIGAFSGKSINAPQDIALPSGDLDDQLQSIISEVTPLTFDSDNNVYSHPNAPVTVGTNNDKSNYTLTPAYDAAKTASQDSDMFDVLSYVTHLTFDSDDKVFANAAVSLTSDDIDQIVNALSFPTAIQNADELLKRDWNSVTGEADRSVLNALRKLRNKVSYSSPTLSIKKEDDLTNAYTQSVTQDSDQEPFKSVG